MESIDKPRTASNVSSLPAMEGEIGDQALELPAFASRLRSNKTSQHAEASDLIFTGAGDSYASSMFACYLSNGEARAADPEELLQNPGLCKDKIVYITSVSGRTKANIRLANRLKQLARRIVAITADPNSTLAKECDDTIQLPYAKKGTTTPGTLSFTLSLLAVSSRITHLPVLRSVEVINVRAHKWAEQSRIFSNREFLFVGSGIGYALSAYGAFKVHEVLGKSADYEHTEQVGHSRVFSVRKTDNIICFSHRWDRKTGKVSKILKENGFNSNLFTSYASDRVVAGLEAALSFQHLALRLAQERGLRQVAFLTDRKTLALSSRLIY